MSEQEKKSSANIIGGSSMVVVEQTTASRHKPPYRPTELQETLPDIQHKRSRAPAVPPVEEELKDSSDKPDIQDRMESEHAISCDKQKHSIAQKLSLNTRRREVSPEVITLAPMEVERMKDAKHLPQPIPAQVSTVALDAAASSGVKEENEIIQDNDSITEEIAELRIAEVAQKSSEWSDDEEAGGLPRSESRSSRVSRVVRQLFCCGVPYESPSEENMSTPRRGFDAI